MTRRKGIPPKPEGHPSSYKPEFADIARRLCAAIGATDVELALCFNVGQATITRWKKKHPDFVEALAAGKGVADERVERALYERAIGYKHKAIKIVVVAKGANMGSEVQEVPYIERFPPDPTSMIFWLKNRRRDRWRDKHDVEHDVSESLAALMAEAYKG